MQGGRLLTLALRYSTPKHENAYSVESTLRFVRVMKGKPRAIVESCSAIRPFSRLEHCVLLDPTYMQLLEAKMGTALQVGKSRKSTSTGEA